MGKRKYAPYRPQVLVEIVVPLEAENPSHPPDFVARMFADEGEATFRPAAEADLRV